MAPIVLTKDLEFLLGLLHQSIVVLQVIILLIYTFCIDVVRDFTQLAHILVTEIGVCDRVLFFVETAGCWWTRKKVRLCFRVSLWIEYSSMCVCELTLAFVLGGCTQVRVFIGCHV